MRKDVFIWEEGANMNQEKAALILERSLKRLESEVEQTLSGYVTPFLGDNSENRLKLGYLMLFSTRFLRDVRKNGVIRLLIDEELANGFKKRVLGLLGQQFVAENEADVRRLELLKQDGESNFISKDLGQYSLEELHQLALDLQLLVVAEKLSDKRF